MDSFTTIKRCPYCQHPAEAHEYGGAGKCRRPGCLCRSPKIVRET